MYPRIPGSESFGGDTAPEPGSTGDPTDVSFPALPVRSCCCSSRPSVTVIMPPVALRPHSVDLHFCGHHYRVSEAALAASGALVIHRGVETVTAV